MAVSQLERSQKWSRGSALNSAPASAPPSRAPTMPTPAVTMRPPGSSPGSSALAIAPAINPSTTHAMMLTMMTSVRDERVPKRTRSVVPAAVSPTNAGGSRSAKPGGELPAQLGHAHAALDAADDLLLVDDEDRRNDVHV